MNSAALCTFLSWDSQYFGLRIAQVTGRKIDQGLIQQISSWCDDHRIDCIYFLADANDDATVIAAEQWAAHFADIRVALKLTLQDRIVQGTLRHIRPLLPEDLPLLREIARQSHYDSRFFFDLHFGRDVCESFYETWLTKSCEGYADAVLVAEVGGAAAGYATCHLENAGQVGRIGLFAVGPKAQGQGIGKELATSALAWFAERGVQEVVVVTQGRNIKAQRLYSSCGFELDSVGLWYHKWFKR